MSHSAHIPNFSINPSSCVRMKSVHFYIAIVFVIAVLLTVVSAEDAQQPFVDDAAITIEDSTLIDGIIPDSILVACYAGRCPHCVSRRLGVPGL